MFATKDQVEMIYPRVVWMTVTSDCNYDCKWCYAKDYNHGSKNMDLIHAKKVLGTLAENNTRKVIFIGGEPTLYHELNALVSYAKSVGMICALVTNGILLANRKYASNLVAAGINSCNISLKGTTEAEYKKDVGGCGLKQALEGYKNLAELGCHTMISFVISTPNREKLFRLKELLISYGISRISFLMEKPSIYSSKESVPDILCLAECCDVVYEIFEGTDIDYKIQLSIPFCAIKRQTLLNLIHKKRIYSCCHIMKGTGIVFDTEFRILPCNHFLGASMSDFPVSPEQIVSFWNSSDVDAFRRKLRCYPSIKCSTCDYWKICGGGCFMRWMFSNPQEIIPVFGDNTP